MKADPNIYILTSHITKSNKYCNKKINTYFYYFL